VNSQHPDLAWSDRRSSGSRFVQSQELISQREYDEEREDGREFAIPTIFFLLILAASSVKIASENQRFVVHRLGRFIGLKGPGFFMIIPGIDKGIRVSIGDRGELTAPGMASIRGLEIPVKVLGSDRVGQMVRIQAFADQEVLVVADSTQMG